MRFAIFLIFTYLGLRTVFVTSQERNTALLSIQSCYTNLTALNRGNRQPMHIENLIAIIRKIEERALHFRDIRRLARTIVKRFQFDGIYHGPDKNPEFQYAPTSSESLKTQIIHDLIPDNADVLEANILDNDERCALHWMVSHSLNATERDEDDLDRYREDPRGPRAERQSNPDTTERPIETGVVYTDWGPISAGRVIAGIAAALMESNIPVVYVPDSTMQGGGSNVGNVPPPANNAGGRNTDWRNTNPKTNNNPWQYGRRKKRQVALTFQNLINTHAATLAGDIGQAAILNSPFNLKIGQLSPPVGVWNDTICPREYILNELPNLPSDSSDNYHVDTWAFMSGAEIRGGIDGLLLASRITALAGRQFTLSQVLEMYYSVDGIYGESTFRACDRSSLISSNVDLSIVREQARSFAYLYNSRLHKISISDQTTSNFNTLITLANAKMDSFRSIISSDPQCSRRPLTDTVTVPDQEKERKPMGMIYAILDHSTDYNGLVAQQRFVAKLAFDLDVSPEGSRLGLVDGRTGQVLISPNFTDNAPILACRILRQDQITQTSNLAQVLRTLRTELTRTRDEQERRGELPSAGNGITVLVFVQQTQLAVANRETILDALREYDEEFGDVRITYTSSRFALADFQNFMLNNDESNFIPIQQQSSGNLSDSTGTFLQNFLQRSHGILQYPLCNEIRYPDQANELNRGVDIFIRPKMIRYYMLSPSTFFSSVDLRLRFSSDNGRVRVCVSRAERYPIHYTDQENTNRGIWCRETSGVYVTPESMSRDIEFTYTKPCRYQLRAGCGPIYVSITPTEVPVASGAVGVDCSLFGCTTPDEVKVTWTHYDMRCNSGAFRLLFSTPATLFLILFSFLYSADIF